MIRIDIETVHLEEPRHVLWTGEFEGEFIHIETDMLRKAIETGEVEAEHLRVANTSQITTAILANRDLDFARIDELIADSIFVCKQAIWIMQENSSATIIDGVHTYIANLTMGYDFSLGYGITPEQIKPFLCEIFHEGKSLDTEQALKDIWGTYFSPDGKRKAAS